MVATRVMLQIIRHECVVSLIVLVTETLQHFSPVTRRLSLTASGGFQYIGPSDVLVGEGW